MKTVLKLKQEADEKKAVTKDRENAMWDTLVRGVAERRTLVFNPIEEKKTKRKSIKNIT